MWFCQMGLCQLWFCQLLHWQMCLCQMISVNRDSFSCESVRSYSVSCVSCYAVRWNSLCQLWLPSVVILYQTGILQMWLFHWQILIIWCLYGQSPNYWFTNYSTQHFWSTEQLAHSSIVLNWDIVRHSLVNSTYTKVNGEHNILLYWLTFDETCARKPLK